MAARKGYYISVALFLVFAFTPWCEAYRPAPKPFSRCQRFMSDELMPALTKLSAEQSEFPPQAFRYDPETGKIPWEVFVEQAMIQHADYRPHWQRNCQYAFAPWVFKKASDREPSYEDFYCTRHGFYSQIYPQGHGHEVSAKRVRDFFSERCRHYQINVEDFNQILTDIDPDPENLAAFTGIKRSFIDFYNRFGTASVVALHLALALLMLFVCQRLYGIRFDRSEWFVALASLWISLQAFYMIIFFQFMLEGWGSRYLRFPGPVLGIMNLSNLVLLAFFVVMLVLFKKNNKPTSPVVALIFAAVPIILILNLLSCFIALWSCKKLCINARSQSRSEMPDKPETSNIEPQEQQN